MDTIYGVSPGEVWWAASDMGWIVGHEYTCYSPLLARNTSVNMTHTDKYVPVIKYSFCSIFLEGNV